MTTIAFKDGIFAADSQLTWDDTVRGYSPDKLAVINNMTVFAGAGNAADIVRMQRFYGDPDWEEKLDKLPKASPKFEALFYTKGRLHYVSGNNWPFIVYDPYSAIGSGWKFCLAAMALDHSAEEAVRFTSTLDVFTDNRVMTYNVAQLQKATKGRRAPRV